MYACIPTRSAPSPSASRRAAVTDRRQQRRADSTSRCCRRRPATRPAATRPRRCARSPRRSASRALIRGTDRRLLPRRLALRADVPAPSPARARVTRRQGIRRHLCRSRRLRSASEGDARAGRGSSGGGGDGGGGFPFLLLLLLGVPLAAFALSRRRQRKRQAEYARAQLWRRSRAGGARRPRGARRGHPGARLRRADAGRRCRGQQHPTTRQCSALHRRGAGARPGPAA